MFIVKLTTVYQIIDPDGYVENLTGIGEGLAYGVTHPKEFAKAITNWDMWFDNPARALGQLVPDLVIAVATMGSGTTASAGARLANTTSKLRTAGKAAAKVDDSVATLKAAGKLKKVRRLGDNFPVNAKYAGQKYPLGDLADKYPKGLRFTDEGFPDFSPYKKAQVRLDNLKGDHHNDFKRANEAIGRAETPKGFTWHHAEDGRTMQLVPKDLHKRVGHTGGVKMIELGLQGQFGKHLEPIAPGLARGTAAAGGAAVATSGDE
ncbi:MAG: HNH endonuclease [Actinomycetota bacterium]|nr:HNH endonuclease [Actinomycetota bacterium]